MQTAGGEEARPVGLSVPYVNLRVGAGIMTQRQLPLRDPACQNRVNEGILMASGESDDPADEEPRRWFRPARWSHAWPFLLGLLGALAGVAVYIALDSKP